MTKQVEITVKVNGIVAPLSTISTETFEKIKKESEPKKIPVVRLGNHPITDGKRLILRVPQGIEDFLGKVIAIDLDDGVIANNWNPKYDKHDFNGVNFYDNVRVIE